MNNAANGIRRALDGFDKAASEVTRQSALGGAGPAASVTLSPEARQIAEQAPGAGIEQALVDMRTAKHSVAANTRVLQTADAVNDELIGMFGPERGH